MSHHKDLAKTQFLTKNIIFYLLASVLSLSLSPWVLNEWYLLGTILNCRLGWDGNNRSLISFLTMAPITWQKILKKG